MKRIYVFIIFLCLLGPEFNYCQNNKSNAVIQYYYWKNRDSFDTRNIDVNSKNYLLICLIKVYKNYFSGLKGQECPMVPHCSKYGIEAVSKYGVFGVFKAADRILRCGHHLNIYDQVLVFNKSEKNKIKYIDNPYTIKIPSVEKSSLRTLTCIR